jgi:hypothetical protein
MTRKRDLSDVKPQTASENTLSVAQPGQSEIMRRAAYRAQVRETMQRFSDQALAYQDSIIRGGIDREECDRELRRRHAEQQQCPACRGTGGGVWNDCPACDGNGIV